MVEPYLEEAPFEEPCSDIVMGSVAPSIGLIDPFRIEPLDSTPISSLLLLTTTSYVDA